MRMSHLRYVEQPPLGVGEAGPAGLTRCDSIALDFSPSQLPCTAMPVTEGSLHGQESLEERGVACQDVLGKFGFIRVFFFGGGGGDGGRDNRGSWGCWWAAARRRVWQLTQPRLLLYPLRTNSIVIPILSGGEGGRLC